MVGENSGISISQKPRNAVNTYFFQKFINYFTDNMEADSNTLKINNPSDFFPKFQNVLFIMCSISLHTEYRKATWSSPWTVFGINNIIWASWNHETLKKDIFRYGIVLPGQIHIFTRLTECIHFIFRLSCACISTQPYLSLCKKTK